MGIKYVAIPRITPMMNAILHFPCFFVKYFSFDEKSYNLKIGLSKTEELIEERSVLFDTIKQTEHKANIR